ncbi:MAG: bifunctional DNA-formamidopyrimidine glycosylase/DNA-(apurinic or apyrimidinic site) lyase [Candidatus Pacebacteria bacterium]|jgi:formamidopyrimidine-DNA glycosylase|nr:bifunctional DNA-formamidopyrimidine glycosylase/DNA-(apurinic or apyrimidinic site) lyase [Candidatus Paceibacterota bacterium]
MPELPEVETVRLQLLHRLKGRTITAVTVHHEKSTDRNSDFASLAVRKTIEHIDRVGKLMIFSFAGESDFFLLAHLKMTGQFLFLDPTGTIGGGGHTLTPTDTHLPNRHTRITFTLDNGTRLFFNDMRLFGYVKAVNADEVAAARSKFGPEPIHEGFDIEYFIKGLKRRKTPVKAALLDQSFVAGLGNIYVDEALFAAKVRPTRLANKVTRAEAIILAKAAGDVMNKSISVGGTTFQHFVDTGGDNGNYTDYLQVFGKQGTACPRCGTIIKKIRCAGRGTHYCPGCQR